MTQSRDPTDILLGILLGIKNTVIALKGIAESLGDIQSLLEGGGEKLPPSQPVQPVVVPAQPVVEKPKKLLGVFDIPSVASTVPEMKGSTSESRHFAICNNRGLISIDLAAEAAGTAKYVCNVKGCSRAAHGARFHTLGDYTGDKSGQWKGVIGHIGKWHKAEILLNQQ